MMVLTLQSIALKQLQHHKIVMDSMHPLYDIYFKDECNKVKKQLSVLIQSLDELDKFDLGKDKIISLVAQKILKINQVIYCLSIQDYQLKKKNKYTQKYWKYNSRVYIKGELSIDPIYKTIPDWLNNILINYLGASYGDDLQEDDINKFYNHTYLIYLNYVQLNRN